MALTKDNYRELEDIVGTENISEDEAILEGYAFQPLNGGPCRVRDFSAGRKL